MSNSKAYQDYRLSRYRYLELMNFCLQYDEKREKLSGCYTVGATPYDAAKRSSGIGRPTEYRAEKAIGLRRDLELIELAAAHACEGKHVLSEKLLYNVTRRIPYERLGEVPCGRQQFYELRWKFFYILDLLRR